MLDKDLAELYQVEVKVLNQAVKRNLARFPDNFRFLLTKDEHQTIKSIEEIPSLRSQIVTLENSRGKHRKYLPYAFTEQGIAMLSAVLRSEVAVQVSTQNSQTDTGHKSSAEIYEIKISKLPMKAIRIKIRKEIRLAVWSQILLI